MPLRYWQAAILFSKCMYRYTPIPRHDRDLENFETKMTAHINVTHIVLHVTQSAQSQQSYGLWTVLPLILNYVVSVIEEVPKYKNVPVCHFHALLNRLCSEKTWFGQRVSHLVSLYGRMNKKGQKSTTNKLTLIMVESYWCNNAILHTLILLHEKFL